MARYMTMQRKLLLDYLSHHPHEALSAKQIADALGEERISASAVYRNLAVLEEDRLVKRTSRAGSHEAFFQYTDGDGCAEKLHLSCKRCGKTIHMNASGAEMLIRTIAETDGFSVDRSASVIFGICETCQQA